MAVIQHVCRIHLSQRKVLFMNFSESYPGTMIVLGKYTLAKAITGARVVVPSAVFITYFSVAVVEAWEANPVTCTFYEII